MPTNKRPVSRASPRSKSKTSSSSSSRRSAAGTNDRRSRARSSSSSSDDDDRRTRSRSSRARDASGRRRSRSPPSAPKLKRPMTAYMAFIQAKTKNVSMSRPDCTARLRELAAEWMAMTAEQKEEFQAIADRANSSGERAPRRVVPSRQSP